jgi:hypothetical protein
MNYGENLVACQQHVIILCQKHDYLQGQMGNAAETPVLFDRHRACSRMTFQFKMIIWKIFKNQDENENFLYYIIFFFFIYDPIKKDHLASPFQLHSHLLEVNPVKLSNPA